MKTTVELPDELLQRAKIAAARERSSLKKLIIKGLEHVLEGDTEEYVAEDAVTRLRRGYRLGGRPISREESHER